MLRSLRAGGEKGFTIVETMVAVVMLSVVLSVMYRGFDSLQTSAAGNEERLINLEEARVVMATITKDIRAAARLTAAQAPFDVADARELTFYSNIGNTAGPSKIHIYIDAENRLVEEVIAPSGTSPNFTYTSPPTVRAVGNYIVAGQIFTYQYFNEDTGAFVTLGTLPLSATDRQRVESVEVQLSIKKASGRATTLVNRVRLTNVYYNPAAST